MTKNVPTGNGTSEESKSRTGRLPAPRDCDVQRAKRARSVAVARQRDGDESARPDVHDPERSVRYSATSRPAQTPEARD